MTFNVFLSYADQDLPFCKELEKHLSNLERQNVISSWHDGKILPGTEWQSQSTNYLNDADIILLLISADFMASDFCYSAEMKAAIARCYAHQVYVIPILLRPTDWEGAPFASLKMLPTGAKPVTSWSSHDEAFGDVVKGIRQIISSAALVKNNHLSKEKSVTIYLITVKAQKFDIEPDYKIDWRDYFIGQSNKRGHQIKDPADWNRVLLPELQARETYINEETACRLIRARGLARLSAWFAFGYCFSEVARYTIEVDQQGSLWRTDTSATPDFHVVAASSSDLPDGEVLDGEGDTVAVGISIKGLVDEDVRDYLSARTEKIASLLLLRPDRDLGGECLQSAGDVVALANQVKVLTRTFVKRWKATRLLIFYFGPLSGACFLGHQLNAVCQEIQIMEDQQPGYAPSFTLK